MTYIARIIQLLTILTVATVLIGSVSNGFLTKEARRRIKFREIERFISYTDQRLGAPNYQIQLPREKCAVIVEPRKHPELSYVLRNIMYFLDDSWGLMIFHGTENQEFVEEIVRGWGNVVLQDMGVANLNLTDYSALLASKEFWHTIGSEHVLIFQTDTMLRKRGIDQFLEYDYVGAPWSHSMIEKHGWDWEIGNGGLSLRRKSAMLRALKEYPYPIGMEEDAYYSKAMLKVSGHLPTRAVAHEFAVESDLGHPDPLGFHKPWWYLNPGQVRDLVQGISYN